MDVAARDRTDDAIEAVVTLARPQPTVLAVGAFLKNTVCLIQGTYVLVSRNNGNLETVTAVQEFERSVEALLRLADEKPSLIAHDLHPNFHSSRYAEAMVAQLGVDAVPVQHHHAHVAAVMTEHDHYGPVLGLALDGFGLGEGGQSWGGELLLVDKGGFRRLGHLRELGQPGGDKAAREPWRMAAAALHALGRNDEIAKRYHSIDGANVIAAMLGGNVNCPPTSSCGRLFDAACGLLNVKPVANFEGEAPMELERMVRRPRSDPRGWTLECGVLDMIPLMSRLLECDPADGADLFHGTLVAAMTEWVAWAAEATGVRQVAFCGGCFFNKVLMSGLTASLTSRGMKVLTPARLSPGDPAVSVGQAWVAALAKG